MCTANVSAVTSASVIAAGGANSATEVSQHYYASGGCAKSEGSIIRRIKTAPPVSVRVRVRVRASLSFSGCALKLTLLTVGLSNRRTINTEPRFHVRPVTARNGPVA